jgi:hypothetical protein
VKFIQNYWQQLAIVGGIEMRATYCRLSRIFATDCTDPVFTLLRVT